MCNILAGFGWVGDAAGTTPRQPQKTIDSSLLQQHYYYYFLSFSFSLPFHFLFPYGPEVLFVGPLFFGREMTLKRPRTAQGWPSFRKIQGKKRNSLLFADKVDRDSASDIYRPGSQNIEIPHFCDLFISIESLPGVCFSVDDNGQ